MADKLTPQQLEAVNNRGGKLLISAAAGSGKTKVLVDRLMKYVMDPVQPANVDEFLIITYTKAAAGELRGKIAAKLTEKIAEDPENRHLQQQVQRLYLAKISTVHSFCSDILREYAYQLDLPADFRVADENECRELRERTMTQLLDDAYDRIAEDADLRSFVDTQGLGRNDALAPEILLKVYDSARCHLDPEAWLQSCLAHSDTEAMSDASETIWGKFLIDDLLAYLDGQISAIEQCAQLAGSVDGWTKPAALLHDTAFQLRKLRSCKTWDEIVSSKQIDYGRLTFPKKNGDPELADKIKEVRNACKKGLDKKLRSFADHSELVLEDLKQASSAARGMISLVQEFGVRFDRVKRGRRILDFGDLEHKTLDLLLGKSRSGPTAASSEIGKRFLEIMVDEYQDSNAVQDAIFSALTRKRNNLFMVGDVKQSIYQFRLADPGIFLDKYMRYADAPDASDGDGRKVQLNRNFRSSGAILNAANHVFRTCMSEKVGGLIYGDEEALYEGIPHEPLNEPEVEFHAIEVTEDTYEEEAEFVAERISQLLDGTHMVRQGTDLRPIKADDIVILLRSPGSVGKHYQNALERRGIRCTSGGGMDLLKTKEIATLRSILQVICNPRQDIPLVSMLVSPVFAFTADDLALLRANSRVGSIYDTLCSSAQQKALFTLEKLKQLRKAAQMCTNAQLLDEIFQLTKLDSIFASIQPGRVRTANLQAFYQLAVAYEKSGRKDLAQFLDHLQAQEEKGLMANAEAESDAVTIMSIHKSKGLEFPVVFLCGLSREFNRESVRAQVLCDKDLGLGLSCVDAVNRVRYPTISKKAIAEKITSDSISEEMRVLYVAMTRARDRMIMTYSSRNLESDVADLALRMDICDRELLTSQVTCPGEWVLHAALLRTEAGALHCYGRPAETKLLDDPWLIQVHDNITVSGGKDSPEVKKQKLDASTVDQLHRIIDFQYPFLAATQTPSKQTATQRKGRMKDQEASENAAEERIVSRNWRKASFASEKVEGTAYGNAFHAALQYIRYEACTDSAAVRTELDRLSAEGFISREQAEMVNDQKIADFFSTDLGRKLRTGKNVLREFKFSILDDGNAYGDQLDGEQVLLQGVVDCALIEEDGIIVIDFKTDYVTEATIAEKVAYYTPQVHAYAGALERIFEKQVKASFLYFFHIGKFIEA